jgi:hypothetical protein
MGLKAIVAAIATGTLLLGACGSQDPVCDELETLRGSVASIGDINIEQGALSEIQSAVSQIQTDLQAVRDAADEALGGELGTFESTLRELADGVQGAVEAPSAASVAAVVGEVGDTQQAWESLEDAAPDCEL